MQDSDLEKRFIYHAPDAAKAALHQQVRSQALHLAFILNDLLPEGREKSSCITHLEEVTYWANAAIARS